MIDYGDHAHIGLIDAGIAVDAGGEELGSEAFADQLFHDFGRIGARIIHGEQHAEEVQLAVAVTLDGVHAVEKLIHSVEGEHRGARGSSPK